MTYLVEAEPRKVGLSDWLNEKEMAGWALIEIRQGYSVGFLKNFPPIYIFHKS
jgi:hypothetical protein